MKSILVIQKNSYFDSVTLMSLTEELKKAEEIEDVMVAMATTMNKELLKKEKLADNEIDEATENDLVIAAKISGDMEKDQLLEMVWKKLKGDEKESGKKEIFYPTIKSARQAAPDSNLTVISVPGEYAAREAGIALDNGMNVMLFSDNVTLEEEYKLKMSAHEKGLLVMGPDCGTTMINGIGLCFANKVNRGTIGIVGASGTGMQEIMVLVDRFGGGISNALGVGGRDLNRKIGGIMMLDSLKMLEEDKNTKVIVVVSKLPDHEVEQKILEFLRKNITKPVVIYYTTDLEKEDEPGITYADSLLDTARKACVLDGIQVNEQEAEDDKVQIPAFDKKQKYIRGLYCGGTLCAEAFYYMKKKNNEVFSNVSHDEKTELKDVFESKGNTFLDLGDDCFTVGRAHPMIDPTIRLDRIRQECMDPECAVILLDFELGFGSCKNPAGVTAEMIEEGKKLAKQQGREICFVAYVLGTQKDMQNKYEQQEILRKCGCIVEESNYEAVRTACRIVGMEA